MRNISACVATFLCLVFNNISYAQYALQEDVDAAKAAAFGAARMAKELNEKMAASNPAKPDLNTCHQKLEEAKKCYTGAVCTAPPELSSCERTADRIPNFKPAIDRLRRDMSTLAAQTAAAQAAADRAQSTADRAQAGVDRNTRDIAELAQQGRCGELPAEYIEACFDLTIVSQETNTTALKVFGESMNGGEGENDPNMYVGRSGRLRIKEKNAYTGTKTIKLRIDAPKAPRKMVPGSTAPPPPPAAQSSDFNLGEFLALSIGGAAAGCGVGGALKPGSLSKDKGFSESGCGYGGLIGGGSLMIADGAMQFWGRSQSATRPVASATRDGGFLGLAGTF